MEVILREDVSNLGNRGDVVKVADGYARNYLLPKKLAKEATAAPARARRRAMASPMPVAAPVTMAVWPVRSKTMETPRRRAKRQSEACLTLLLPLVR